MGDNRRFARNRSFRRKQTLALVAHVEMKSRQKIRGWDLVARQMNANVLPRCGCQPSIETLAVARAVQHGAAEFGFTALEEEELDDSCAGASTLSLLIFIAVFFFCWRLLLNTPRHFALNCLDCC